MVGKLKIGAVHLLVIAGAVLMAFDIQALGGRLKIGIACGCWATAWLAAFVQAICTMTSHGFAKKEPAYKVSHDRGFYKRQS
jgi:hypothetical protein